MRRQAVSKALWRAALFWLAALLWLAGALSALAAPPPELARRVSAATPVGCAQYGALFFRLYRAEVWTDARQLPMQQFGLSLFYNRTFTREFLVSSSVSEMARMSGRAEESFGTARAELEQAFRRVTKGDRYTAWRSGRNRVEFFYNGRPTGALTQDGDLFLDIWLGGGSRGQRQRAQLLFGGCDA